MHVVPGVITLQGTKKGNPESRHGVTLQGFYGGTLEYDLAFSLLSILPMSLMNLLSCSPSHNPKYNTCRNSFLRAKSLTKMKKIIMSS